MMNEKEKEKEDGADDLAERVTYWANILDRCIDVDYLIDAQSARMILREMREFVDGRRGKIAERE